MKKYAICRPQGLFGPHRAYPDGFAQRKTRYKAKKGTIVENFVKTVENRGKLLPTRRRTLRAGGAPPPAPSPARPPWAKRASMAGKPPRLSAFCRLDTGDYPGCYVENYGGKVGKCWAASWENVDLTRVFHGFNRVFNNVESAVENLWRITERIKSAGTQDLANKKWVTKNDLCGILLSV